MPVGIGLLCNGFPSRRCDVNADDLPLPYLSTFSKAAELSSFTAAAKALGLTQAAVSQRIQLLERALNVSLFSRRGGRVIVTEAGQTLYVYAQRIDDLLREARREVSGHETPPAGDLVIAASSVPGEHLLPAVLAGFGRMHPHIRVRAAVTDSLAATALVERGEVSVGLVGRKVDRPHLEFRYLASDRLVLVAPAGHPLARKKVVTADQLAEHPLVVREAGSGSRHCFEQALARVGRSVAALRVVLELGSNEAIRDAIRQGVGVAVLSAYAFDSDHDAGRLVARPLDGLCSERDMFLVLDRRRVLPLPSRLFLNFIESHPIPAHTS